MKTLIQASLVLGAGVCLLSTPARAAVYPPYYGNGYGDGGGGVGSGNLTFSDNGTTVRGVLNPSTATFRNYVILFIDSKSGGFTSTANFSDNNTAWTRTVSGYSSTGSRATANFASGFAADYAIVLFKPSAENGTLQLYQLTAGSSLGAPITSSTISGSTSWQFSFNLSDIGATGNYFKFEGSTASDAGSGYRYMEGLESVTGSAGFRTINFNNYDSYGVEPVPETTNAGLAVFGGAFLFMATVSRARRWWKLKNAAGI